MKHWIILIFLLSSMHLFAQPHNAEVEEKDGKKYYVHIVQAGNSLWGIHNLYNVNVDDIVAVNPGVENGVQEGQKLLIPVFEKNISTEPPVVMTPEVKHIVKSQETMYGISKKYGITIEQLISANPSAKKGAKIGQELLIPSIDVSKIVTSIPLPNKNVIISFSDTIIEHLVLAHETLYSISKRFMVPVLDLQSVNDLNNSKIKPGDIIKIPIKKEKIQKVEIREVKPSASRTEDTKVNDRRKTEYSIVILLPFFLDKGNGYVESVSDLATQFYMGAQLAIDSLDKLGLKAKVYVYDSQNDTSAIKIILNQIESNHADLVIGPLFPDKMNVVARWCKLHQVQFICPVSCNSDLLKGNPFVYAAIPSDITLLEGAAKYILNNSINTQIVLVKPTSAKDILLYESFRTSFLNSSLVSKGIRPKLIETNLQDFKTYIKKEGNTLFVMPTVEEGTAKKFMNTLVSSSSNVNASITVFGTKEWLNFDQISGTYKNKFNLHFASPNDFNYTYDATKKIVKKYRKTYGADMPKMAVQGFDVILYFSSKYLLDQEPTAGIMSDIKMVQKGEGNGFENNNCYILKQEDFEIIKLAETYE